MTEQDLLIQELRRRIAELESGCKKCRLPEGMKIYPDGRHELDPCVYVELERHEDVTVVVSRCRKCGNIDISWVREKDITC